MFKKIKSKNAIGPVIGTILLLAVAVVTSTIIFQWYTNFSSGVLTDNEKRINDDSSITRIENVINNRLYFRNGLGNLSITKINIGNKNCNITSNITKGLKELSLGNCTQNLSSNNSEITIYTNKGVYSKYIDFSNN